MKGEQTARALETTLSAIADFAYIFDKDGRFLYVNAALLNLWGLPLDQAVGKNFFELQYPHDLATRLHRQIQHVVDTGENVKDETPYTSPTGAGGYDEYIFSPVRGEHGEIEMVAGSTRDITERKNAERDRETLLTVHRALEARNAELLDAERAARAQAERVGRIKDDFLATLSHELRTPLNAILGWTQILRNGSPSSEQLARGLETIERNARAQTQLIDDLLDMSGIISGKLRLVIESVSPVALIEAAIETMTPAANAKGIRIDQALDGATGDIACDPQRLQQVVWNLLSNAVKFTPRGGEVLVTLESASSHLRVAVSDTGPGIGPEFLPHVFD